MKFGGVWGAVEMEVAMMGEDTDVFGVETHRLLELMGWIDYKKGRG